MPAAWPDDLISPQKLTLLGVEHHNAATTLTIATTRFPECGKVVDGCVGI
jgi:hypothetical protein